VLGPTAIIGLGEEKIESLVRLKHKVKSDVDLKRLWGTEAVPIVCRLVLAIGGGYAVSAGLAAFAAVGLPAVSPLPRSEAVVLASTLAFLVYLAILIWAFAERRLSRLGLILVAAGAVSWTGAWAIARTAAGG
jgi:hypothetical protein